MVDSIHCVEHWNRAYPSGKLRISGSHHILSNGQRKVTVPVHGASDVKIGTLKSIETQAGVKLK
ncbi:MAG: type II toxin-antitoxin system HicA family toxin [Pseudomonadales bacterium]|nr:type II toxin-antitoxin system HicA family toxin [Pseudomonadales bacterium]